MRPKPPCRNRHASSDISVALDVVLKELFELLEFDRSASSRKYGEPGEYDGASRRRGSTFARSVEYLAQEVMSKYDDADPASEALKTAGALAKFREAEALCVSTNCRFEKYFYGHRPENPDVARVILRARDKIWRLLGTLDLNEIARDFTFTNGGSVKLSRRSGSSVHKYSSALEVTESSELAITSALQTIPAWGRLLADGPGISIVPGNKLTCVPKNYKVHRMIAGEPTGSMYIQKGIHACLRSRLRSVGIDLSNQKTNQDWAHFGSATGCVATVDMSMASDTVAKTVVEWFVPEDWFNLMNLVRSPVGQFASGEKVLYRKFSSMGNAFTFELETLLFWALATATCDVVGSDHRFVGVYGDDVIIPVRACDLFLLVLEECGFKPNAKKTCVQGRFRESCGKHYFRGEDVSPFYIKKPVKGLPELFLLVNNLERWRRRVSELSDFPVGLHEPLREFVKGLRSIAPSNWRRPRIPDGYGDGAFIGTFDECLPSRPFGKRRQFEGWQVEVLTEKRDTAFGIVYDTNGRPRPMVRSQKGVKVGQYDPSFDNVSLHGYLLSKLEKAEKKGPSWWIRQDRLQTLREFAIAVKDLDLSGEVGGLVLQESARWEITTMVVPQF